MSTATLNHCNLPPWAIASRHFNRQPQTLEIQGVCRANRLLFERLEEESDEARRATIFNDFMDVTFQLHQWQQQKSVGGRKSLKNSYLRFLRGWMFDSNGREGAVLKGWVESRFGLHPTYHEVPIEDPHSEGYFHFLVQRMRGAVRTSAIHQQLDVLYEFTQYELRRRFPEKKHFTLYRGVYDFKEHVILEQIDKHHCLMRLNNLNSFTGDFERAWEFGSRVLKTKIPLAKIVFFNGLLPTARLQGEEEYLVIGGEYEVEVMIGG
ncbi:MAG: N-acyl homoserine lactonase [Desulfuromonadales bacterium C00003096]|nr:MAG: N-acyl homoserine lactonase [Desulfuromonadales bacterium C00003096]